MLLRPCEELTRSPRPCRRVLLPLFAGAELDDSCGLAPLNQPQMRRGGYPLAMLRLRQSPLLPFWAEAGKAPTAFNFGAIRRCLQFHSSARRIEARILTNWTISNLGLSPSIWVEVQGLLYQIHLIEDILPSVVRVKSI